MDTRTTKGDTSTLTARLVRWLGNKMPCNVSRTRFSHSSSVLQTQKVDKVFRTKSEAISLLPRSHKVHNMIKHFGEKSLKPRVGYENSKRNENLYMRKSQERNIPIYILTRSKPIKRKDTPNYEKLYDEKWNMYVVDPGEYQGHSTEYKADRRFNAKKHKLKAMDIINKQLNKKLIARSNFKPKTSRRHAYDTPIAYLDTRNTKRVKNAFRPFGDRGCGYKDREEIGKGKGLGLR
ncbi:unnamed protein product [Spodoptera exigua]|nr:unnamed protein product [Spodoptera exigua]